MRLAYPVRVIVTTTSSTAIRSSTDTSPSNGMIFVRRSSPYFSTITSSSSRMIARCRSCLSMMSLRSAISASIAASSSAIFCRSRAASRRSCSSRIAFACTSSMSSRLIRPVRAISTVSDRRISAMTSSSASSALT